MKEPATPRETPFDVALRRATKGHRDWIVWTDRDSVQHAAPCTADAIKRALLALGTQKRFIRLSAGTGTGSVVRWRIGLVMLRNCRRGLDGPRVRI